MEKQLTSVGNSVAIVIDRALCRMFDLRRGSSVRVSTDGQRIVIEPLGMQKAVQKEVQKKPASLSPTIQQIVETLVVHSIPEWALARLHPGLQGPRLHAKAIGWSDMMTEHAPAEDQLHARRFRVCFEQLRAGATWEAAVEAALKSD